MMHKYHALIAYIKDLESVAVAFSGGVDSTFLLAAAVETLGDRALGVIGRSATYPQRELEAAVNLARQIGARIHFIDTDELDKEEFNSNPPTRCFACKSTLLNGIWEAARANGCKYVLEGSNVDDLGDFRPGLDAVRQLHVKTPLIDLNFSKDEIRALAKKMDLPTWNKPASACLSSRIPYGQKITIRKLNRIEQAEDVLRDMGFVQLRVRDYDETCRIEVPCADLPRFMAEGTRKDVIAKLKIAGYKFICLDLEGYRSGSMNEVLSTNEKEKARKEKLLRCLNRSQQLKPLNC